MRPASRLVLLVPAGPPGWGWDVLGARDTSVDEPARASETAAERGVVERSASTLRRRASCERRAADGEQRARDEGRCRVALAVASGSSSRRGSPHPVPPNTPNPNSPTRAPPLRNVPEPLTGGGEPPVTVSSIVRGHDGT